MIAARATAPSATSTAWSARLASSVRFEVPIALSTAKSRCRSSAERYTTAPMITAATIHNRNRTRSIEAIAPSSGWSVSWPMSSIVMSFIPSGTDVTSPSTSTALITSRLRNTRSWASLVS